ncbi:hypothetical protein BU16DRAFT_205564 [Lophium mytilinum]|uniref:RING-type domain-containing protein n=1 Tax=Lophium mytilinum TaxID=390894 RepID=A0A6A6RBH1_9PEZI|nr:hypothetical protein BU16DRAFT_205564 [Lophium mytilinum]
MGGIVHVIQSAHQSAHQSASHDILIKGSRIYLSRCNSSFDRHSNLSLLVSSHQNFAPRHSTSTTLRPPATMPSQTSQNKHRSMYAPSYSTMLRTQDSISFEDILAVPFQSYSNLEIFKSIEKYEEESNRRKASGLAFEDCVLKTYLTPKDSWNKSLSSWHAAHEGLFAAEHALSRRVQPLTRRDDYIPTLMSLMRTSVEAAICVAQGARDPTTVFWQRLGLLPHSGEHKNSRSLQQHVNRLVQIIRLEIKRIKRRSALFLGSCFRGPAIGDREDHSECLICRHPYGGVHHLPLKLICGHVWGTKCILTWVSSNNGNSNTCPKCRKVLVPPRDWMDGFNEPVQLVITQLAQICNLYIAVAGEENYEASSLPELVRDMMVFVDILQNGGCKE